MLYLPQELILRAVFYHGTRACSTLTVFCMGGHKLLLASDLLLFVVKLGKKLSPKDPGPLGYLKNWFV